MNLLKRLFDVGYTAAMLLVVALVVLAACGIHAHQTAEPVLAASKEMSVVKEPELNNGPAGVNPGVYFDSFTGMYTVISWGGYVLIETASKSQAYAVFAAWVVPATGQVTLSTVAASFIPPSGHIGNQCCDWIGGAYTCWDCNPVQN
jgi:hypothetical protein